MPSCPRMGETPPSRAFGIRQGWDRRQHGTYCSRFCTHRFRAVKRGRPRSGPPAAPAEPKIRPVMRPFRPAGCHEPKTLVFHPISGRKPAFDSPRARPQLHRHTARTTITARAPGLEEAPLASLPKRRTNNLDLHPEIGLQDTSNGSLGRRESPSVPTPLDLNEPDLAVLHCEDVRPAAGMHIPPRSDKVSDNRHLMRVRPPAMPTKTYPHHRSPKGAWEHPTPRRAPLLTPPTPPRFPPGPEGFLPPRAPGLAEPPRKALHLCYGCAILVAEARTRLSP